MHQGRPDGSEKFKRIQKNPVVVSGVLEITEDALGNLRKTCPIRFAGRKTSLPAKASCRGHLGRHEVCAKNFLKICFPQHLAVPLRIVRIIIRSSPSAGNTRKLAAAILAAASYFAKSGNFSVFWRCRGASERAVRTAILSDATRSAA